jgi:hypothetical protein
MRNSRIKYICFWSQENDDGLGNLDHHGPSYSPGPETPQPPPPPPPQRGGGGEAGEATIITVAFPLRVGRRRHRGRFGFGFDFLALAGRGGRRSSGL